MNTQPLISVITVTYQAADILEQTILSVLTQSYARIEYLIVDGGSTDGTAELAEKYRDRLAVYISEPDQGVYDAMNKACRLATGDWVYFLGAGDLLLNVLSKVAPDLADPSVIYYGDVYKLDDLKVYDGHFSAFKLAVRNISHQAMFYPAAVFREFEFNLKYAIQADHDLNMRLFGSRGYRFQYLPLIICAYEGDGISAKKMDLAFFADKPAIIKANLPFTAYYYALLRSKLAKRLNRRHWTKSTLL